MLCSKLSGDLTFEKFYLWRCLFQPSAWALFFGGWESAQFLPWRTQQRVSLCWLCVLQCGAVCCSCHRDVHGKECLCVGYVCRSAVQYVAVVATRCSVLQHVAACCSVLQCPACTMTYTAKSECVFVAVCCSVLQYVVLCCSVSQCVVVCWSAGCVLQCVAVCVCLWLCVVRSREWACVDCACCSVLQCVGRMVCACGTGWLRLVGSLKL